MTIFNIYDCCQDDFGARSDGSCEGISFYYCMRSINQGPLSGLASLLEQQSSVTQNIERIMGFQDEICDRLLESGDYETDRYGKGLFDTRGSLAGVRSAPSMAAVRNQSKAIQEFHILYSREALASGCKAIGTLSIFFEGGFIELLARTIELLNRGATGSALIAMQGKNSHSVALAYDGFELYLFDPNFGVHEVTMASASVELVAWLARVYGVPECVHTHIFKPNQ